MALKVMTTAGPKDPTHLGLYQVDYITAITVSGCHLEKARAAFPGKTPQTGTQATFVGSLAKTLFCHLMNLHLK